MDARINVYGLLGLAEGQAHVIRNAGGVVTADVLRSLAISQRVLGTREVMLVHHTRCGLIGFDADDFRRSIRDETGVEPAWEDASIGDLDADVRAAVARVAADPTLTADLVRGFVYDVESARLREVV
jgi:carbonic anhydrase